MLLHNSNSQKQPSRRHEEDLEVQVLARSMPPFHEMVKLPPVRISERDTLVATLVSLLEHVCSEKRTL